MSRVRGTAAPATPRLVLVGTVHGDPRGYGRALQLLTALAPDAVAVEISAFSVRYRKRHGERWRRLLAAALAELPPGAGDHLALRRVAVQVALPFEYAAARDYARRTGISWEPVDAAALARRHLPRYAAELLTPENLRALLATPDGSFSQWVAGEYARARRLLQGGAAPAWRTVTEEERRREHLLARRLRRLASRHGRVVHLGGWEHLATRSDGAGLAAQLADLNPELRLLDEEEGKQIPAAVYRGSGVDY